MFCLKVANGDFDHADNNINDTCDDEEVVDGDGCNGNGYDDGSYDSAIITAT